MTLQKNKKTKEAKKKKKKEKACDLWLEMVTIKNIHAMWFVFLSKQDNILSIVNYFDVRQECWWMKGAIVN